jgi:hypothetical protein
LTLDPAASSLSAMTMRRGTAGLLLFVPVMVGFAVMLAGGAPVTRWGVQLAALLLGWLAYLIVRRLSGDGAWTRSRWLPILGVGFLGSTLLAADIDGVNRWHLIGPLRLHCSALLTPVLVVVAAGAVRARPVATAVMLTACQLVHVAQPDAGQATALGAAGAWVLMNGTTSPLAGGLGIASAAFSAIAWMRPDPLPPAPFVEDIVAVAFRVTPLVGVLSLLSMIPIALAPLTIAPAPRAAPTANNARTGLALYLVGTMVVPFFGEFPIPLLGFGPSPVVGAFLGLAALEILARAQQIVTDDDRATLPRNMRGDSNAPHQRMRIHSAYSTRSVLRVFVTARLAPYVRVRRFVFWRGVTMPPYAFSFRYSVASPMRRSAAVRT